MWSYLFGLKYPRKPRKIRKLRILKLLAKVEFCEFTLNDMILNFTNFKNKNFKKLTKSLRWGKFLAKTEQIRLGQTSVTTRSGYAPHKTVPCSFGLSLDSCLGSGVLPWMGWGQTWVSSILIWQGCILI